LSHLLILCHLRYVEIAFAISTHLTKIDAIAVLLSKTRNFTLNGGDSVLPLLPMQFPLLSLQTSWLNDYAIEEA